MKFLKEKIWWIVGLLGVYLVSAGGAWAGFSYLLAAPGEGGMGAEIEDSRRRIDTSGPKTEVCPLNGAKFTKAEREIWDGRRPMIVMIENHADSRPPSGVANADIIYEAVAEGGITRFMGVFLCGASAADVKMAPIRSTRIYFIDWAAEYGDRPLYVHVGGANDFDGSGTTDRKARALEELADLGWRVRGGNDIDTIFDAGFPEMWRDYERLGHPVATEHTYVGSSDRIWEEAEERGLGSRSSDGEEWDETFVSWKFDENEVEGEEASEISFYFWQGQFQDEYAVKWQYDGDAGKYLRFNGGQAHTDLETGEQLAAANVVVMLVRERGPVDENKHLLYDNIGKGDALVFRNGKVIEGQWQKQSQTARTKFFVKKTGAEVSFAPGVVWVEVLPKGNEVEY